MSSRNCTETLLSRLRRALGVLLGSGEPPRPATPSPPPPASADAPPTPPTPPTRAASAAEGSAELERRTLLNALIAVYDQERSKTLRGTIRRAFGEVGVVEYDPTGERYDPERHIATTRVPTDDVSQEGLIAAVEQTGLRDRGHEIRRPRVLVFEDGAGREASA